MRSRLPLSFVGPVLLGGIVCVAALAAALGGALLHVPPKRPALAVAACVELLFAARRPAALWNWSSIRAWELLLGSRRIRVGLLALGVLTGLLAVLAPLPWLRVLPR